MADAYAGFRGGDYANKSSMKRGLERALSKGPVEIVPAGEVVKPVPNKDWCYEAKEMWTLAASDEATDKWGSGDWLRLKIACDYYDAMLTGRTRYSAQAMEVIMSSLTELRLSDRAKRQDGIIIDRSDALAGDQEWLNSILDDDPDDE